MATWDLREAVNASSADFADDVSEPERVGLDMLPCNNVKPPRVARSPVAIECKYNKTVEMFSSDGKLNPSAIIIGEVIGVHIDDSVIVNGHVDLTLMKPIARLGYMDYSVVDKIFSMQRPGKPHEDEAPEQSNDPTAVR